MFFPYKDDNPTELTPTVTVGLIVANLLVWVLVQGMGAAEPLARSTCELGLVPGEILRTLPPGVSFSPELQQEIAKMYLQGKQMQASPPPNVPDEVCRYNTVRVPCP